MRENQIKALALSPFIPSNEKPWDKKRVLHLYRRIGFGANIDEVNDALSTTPSELIDNLLDEAFALPEPAAPYWGDWTMEDYENANNGELDYEHFIELVTRWLKEMFNQSVRSKIALFWHNHFVTQEEVYSCNGYMWSYYHLLHKHALGNFKSFVTEMSKNPAMLVYLNGNQNIADEPNENYARELMELFTMGVNNGYTQDDIVEVSKALTGWKASDYLCTPAYFEPDDFDNGQKIIFGETGNWNFDDVHNLIFEHREAQVAQYICGKIYSHFVYPEIDPIVVNELASVFIDNDWDILPVLKTLFKSDHFFEDKFIGAGIKSPFENFITLINCTVSNLDDQLREDAYEFIYYRCNDLGQSLFNPVNVAGWPGHRTWINENTITKRWNETESVLSWYLNENTRPQYRNIAKTLSDNSSDADYVTRVLTEHYLGRPLDDRLHQAALLYFKADIPENYFEQNIWNLNFEEVPDQVINLLYFLTRLPEYQLN